MNPILAVTLVLFVLAALVGVVKFASLQFNLPPEISRKSIHIGMGIVCLSFPWLFQENWPVFLLAILAGCSLAAIRLVPWLNTRLGSVLGGVARNSWGEIYFPISVALVFALSGPNILAYVIPVLQLAVADAVGALIGIRYGGHRFQTDDGEKSAEGSAAFFITAFLAVHVPLLLFSSVGRVESILVSILLGLILMLMEAISWRGLDNLFIPLTCHVVLQKVSTLSSTTLFIEIAILLTLIAAAAFWRRRTHLSRSASIGAGLILYAAWILGGWPWMLGPLSALAGYTLLCSPQQGRSGHHSIEAVFAVAAPGLFWIYTARTTGNQALIYPYGMAYAAHLGMIAAAFFLRSTSQRSIATGIAFSTSVAFIWLAAPYWIVWRHNPHLLPLSISAFFLLALSVALFVIWQPQVRECPVDTGRWIRQGSIATAASGVGMLVIVLIEPWTLSIF